MAIRENNSAALADYCAHVALAALLLASCAGCGSTASSRIEGVFPEGYVVSAAYPGADTLTPADFPPPDYTPFDNDIILRSRYLKGYSAGVRWELRHVANPFA